MTDRHADGRTLVSHNADLITLSAYCSRPATSAASRKAEYKETEMADCMETIRFLTQYRFSNTYYFHYLSHELHRRTWEKKVAVQLQSIARTTSRIVNEVFTTIVWMHVEDWHFEFRVQGHNPKNTQIHKIHKSHKNGLLQSFRTSVEILSDANSF